MLPVVKITCICTLDAPSTCLIKWGSKAATPPRAVIRELRDEETWVSGRSKTVHFLSSANSFVRTHIFYPL